VGRLFLLLIFIILSGLLPLNDTVCQEPNEPISGTQDSAYLLADIQHQITPDYTNILIATNEKIEFIYYSLSDPHRIVIDLLGVIFCELEQDLHIQQGPVSSIRIIEDPTVARPDNLDEYFYAVDYMIIELREEYPFNTFYSKDSKVIAVQIQAKMPEGTIIQQRKAPVPDAVKDIIPIAPEGKEIIPVLDESTMADVIIEDVEYDVNSQSSIVAIGSNKELDATIYELHEPYRIVIEPSQGVICELEETMEPMDGLIKSISITRDASITLDEAQGEFFYPLKNIIIEPIMTLPFSSHIADGGRINIIRVEKPIAKPQPKKRNIEGDVFEKLTALEEKIASLEKKIYEPEPLRIDQKREIIEEVTSSIHQKQEELFTQAEQGDARSRAIREARDKAKAIRAIEKIGIEELEDLMIKGEGTTSLKYCRDIALSYSEPAAIAEEEVTLAELKLRENYRALFPNAKLKASRTTGDTVGVGFTEQLYGIEVEHPLYEGGRLRNAYRQSKVNLNLASARYDKVAHDLDYKVAEAYYGVVTSTMNMKLQQELIKKAEFILKVAQKRRSSELSTDLELFNVKSQYNQVQFQLASAERDLALSRFKLEQAVGLDIAEEDINIAAIETELGFEIIDIDLNKCLELARSYHPDIIVNELLIDSNEYEEKIAKAKNKFKVDITGFVGRSGSYYETEDLKMHRDWNVGVKVSKPFWGNTASYSFTKEETKKKVGLTDRQGTEVQSGEIGILDAMSVASEVREAEIKRHKSENELIEASRQVNLEVKEAYYNYQEAVIQVKNTLEKVRFQNEAVKTARAQARLNEAMQSQVLEAEIKLTDERSLYVKALSDYNFSLTKLNKAIGIADYFSLQ